MDTDPVCTELHRSLHLIHRIEASARKLRDYLYEQFQDRSKTFQAAVLDVTKLRNRISEAEQQLSSVTDQVMALADTEGVAPSAAASEKPIGDPQQPERGSGPASGAVSKLIASHKGAGQIT